ncbi:MAG: hypothetical protein GY756_25485 [bacterium]|nr:hypothetical protein [bacterium]
MNLNKNNLKLKIDELEGIIGNTFIHDLTTQYEKICLKSIPNWLKDLEYENMHPFIHWWLSLQYCLKETNKELQLKLNDESIRALELLDNLNVIKKRNSIDRLISALQKKAKFFSTVFETRIAAEYITAGNRIQIMDENGRDGKQFDFLMTNNFVKYAVECKSMENDFDKKKCQKLIETLVKRISNEKRIHIHYEIEDILTSSMYNRIIQETIDNIKKENLEYPNLEQRKGYKIFQYKIIENVN